MSRLTRPDWNDPEDQFAVQGVTPNSTFTVRVRRVLKRLDSWTLIAFNPRYPSPSRD